MVNPDHELFTVTMGDVTMADVVSKVADVDPKAPILGSFGHFNALIDSVQ